MTFTPQTRIISAVTAGGVVLLLIAGAVWWNFIYESPRHVFEGMLQNNLRTSSVTKYEKTVTSGKTVEQYVHLQLGSTDAAQWLVSIKQPGLAVTTESIGTPTSGYVRYVAASTTQKNAAGKTVNFAPILHVWGKADTKDQSSLKELFSQSILDVGTVPAPPIGNVTPEQQENILQFMQSQNIFTPNYQTMKRTTVNGRKVYVYDVAVKLAPYVKMMQVFSNNIGLHELDSLDPTQYQTTPPIKITISVDAASHQLQQLAYPSSGFSETYSDYGITTPIQIPTKTIPVSELQVRLQKL